MVSMVALSSSNVSSQVSDCNLSLPPAFPCFFILKIITSFLSKNFLPFKLHSPRRLIFVVLPFVFSTLPPVSHPSISLVILVYVCMCTPVRSHGLF